MSGRAARRRGAKVAKTKQVAKPYEPKPVIQTLATVLIFLQQVVR